MADSLIRKFDEQEIKFLFQYHPPTTEQRAVYEKINAAFIECASQVAGLLPDGPGKTIAMRKLSDARMSCNAAVALEGRF